MVLNHYLPQLVLMLNNKPCKIIFSFGLKNSIYQDFDVFLLNLQSLESSVKFRQLEGINSNTDDGLEP